jgi:starch phosphorylase
MMPDKARVAYFSMEIGLDAAIPTYSGGLGVLAGDTIRSAADLEVPMVAVTLLHRRGYFHQRLDAAGRQSEEPVSWPIDDYLEPLAPRVSVEVEGRAVNLRAWRYQVNGVTGFKVPVIFLDAHSEENDPQDRALTDSLYGGDDRYRLCQEVILGAGGARMLRALGYAQVDRWHLNEGHAALLILALLEEQVGSGDQPSTVPAEVIEAVREQCVFTTHTPVPAGHDKFPPDLARQVLGERRWNWLRQYGQEAVLNLTDLALRSSRFINGVAMKHGEVSRGMFPDYPIHAITNGVHTVYWAAPAFQRLYDHHLPGWRHDALTLRYAINIPTAEIWEAHRAAKRELLEYVNRRTNAGLDQDVLTIAFARRATAYKRAALIFQDLERLKNIARQTGPFQLVFAGKAHPRDEAGKALIRQVNEMSDQLRDQIRIVYLENYDMAIAKLLCAGSDVWLNTPLPPMEASGTSGMKAAVNGVPSLSVLDGWWIEGYLEGVTGWAIGKPVEAGAGTGGAGDALHAASLYDKLESRVLPCFYQSRERFIEIMRNAIAHNGSFFSSQRMVWQYLHNAYRVS